MARHWLTRLHRATVVVHLTDGTTLRGVLVGVHSDVIVLTAAAYLDAAAAASGGEDRIPLDGDAVIPRERVAWYQDLHSIAGGQS